MEVALQPRMGRKVLFLPQRLGIGMVFQESSYNTASIGRLAEPPCKSMGVPKAPSRRPPALALFCLCRSARVPAYPPTEA